jgi:hypothetical protein
MPMQTERDFSFPPGSRLLAKITPLERERGFFIIGHRLEPFRAVDIAPWDESILTESGEERKTRFVSIPLDDVWIFFSFFGTENFPRFLILQDETNARPLTDAMKGNRDVLARIKVVDMQDIYASAGLSAGDYLSLELIDNSGLHFVARPCRAESITSDRRADWFHHIDRAKDAARQSLDCPLHPTQFIRELYRRLPASVLQNPAASFSEYFNESRSLKIEEFMGKSFMWVNTEDISSLLLGNVETRPDDELDDVSKLLAEIGLALDSVEITAFVRDALWRGEGVDEAMRRCFVGVETLGIPKKKLAGVLENVRMFGIGIAQCWNRADEKPDIADFRSCVLDIYSQFLAWFRRIGGLFTSPMQLQTKDFNTLFEQMNSIVRIIHAIHDGEYDAEEELSSSGKQVSILGERTKKLMEKIEAELTAEEGGSTIPTTPKKRKTKNRRPAEKLYTFEVRIADIDPPIRRLLVVPGNRSLKDLHLILQRAFGWSDSHLHLFRIRNEIYSTPSPDDFDPVLDERKIHLDDLGLRARNKFLYVYDYGDNWEHEFTVVSTQKAGPADIDRPVCLTADRSCPPEDCGGVPGYEALLAALKKPASKRNKDEAELAAWCGKAWDPDYCDLESINKAISKL